MRGARVRSRKSGALRLTGITHQVVRYASRPYFRVGFCPEKLPGQPTKPYIFPIEHAGNRSMRLVFALPGHTPYAVTRRSSRFGLLPEVSKRMDTATIIGTLPALERRRKPEQACGRLSPARRKKRGATTNIAPFRVRVGSGRKSCLGSALNIK